MNTSCWGPPAWRWLHALTFIPAGKNEEGFRTSLFQLLEFLFPCKYCRASYGCFIQSNPIKENRARQQWLFDIHNLVNVKLDKPVERHFERIKQQYEQGIAREGSRYFTEDFWYFLFALVENYPRIGTPYKQTLYRAFFRTAAQLFTNTRFGSVLHSEFTRDPITLEDLEGRASLYKWLYSWYTRVTLAQQQHVARNHQGADTDTTPTHTKKDTNEAPLPLSMIKSSMRANRAS